MLKPQKTVISIVSFLVISVSSAAFAQAAQPGKQCVDGKTPFLSCINPDGADDGVPEDVRLYISENQTCVEGNIVDLNKSINGHVFNEPGQAQVSKIAFSGVRTHFEYRGYDFSMELPTSAEIKNDRSAFSLAISTEVEADYEDADITTEWHYKGTFKKFDLKGKELTSGRLYCSVNL